MKKQLIIIEDSETDIELMEFKVGRALLILGFEVVVCRTIAEVLEKFSNGFPSHSIILLDGNLPDGKTIERRILDLFTDETRGNTAVTTNDDRIKVALRAAGFKHFIEKENLLPMRMWAEEKAIPLAA